MFRPLDLDARIRTVTRPQKSLLGQNAEPVTPTRDADEAANTDVARSALEIACAGRDAGAIPAHYDEAFVDHVNALTYHGVEGARRSVALYRELFPDLRFEVQEQVTEGDRVASRWKLHGTHRGRSVELWGIVISRLRDGKIVEDWAASDTLELAKQLGVWRSLALLIRHWRLLRG